MVSVNQLCSKLNELGYSFKSEHARTKLFRRGTDRVMVPRKTNLEEETVRSILRQTGCSEAEIESFITAADP